MTDLVITLPAHGDAPWDATLNAAITAVLGRVNQNSAAIEAGTGGGGGGGPITADGITDATTVGKALIRATDQTAARTAIGASAVIDTSVFALKTITINGKPLSANVVLAESDIAGLVSDLAAKAPVASPTFTGTPAAPTQTPGTNSTALATTAFVKASLDGLINSAPGTLDTLGEIAAQLATDESAVTALTTAVAGKVPATRTIAGKALSADVTLAKADVGLGNVDNTSDANKPVSTAQAAADALKANIASPTFTGVPIVPAPTVGGSPTTKTYVDTAISALPNIGLLLSTDSDPTTPGFWFREA